jgi:hypothetical protein
VKTFSYPRSLAGHGNADVAAPWVERLRIL